LQNLDERLQSILKAAFYSVKPPPSGPRKKAKEYPPLEAFLRNLLLVRLEPSESVVSVVTKQLVRFPWNDPSYQCGALVCKIMLKACRKGRYNTIEAVAAVAAKLRTQRAAGEVTVRLVDAVIEELRWALDNPNFRDQQRIITYTRLFGELYCTNQVTGNMVIDQLYNFINSGHEIPDSLREASKQFSAQVAMEHEPTTSKLPVFNSSGGATTVIQEDEEMEEPELVTAIEEPENEPKPVAVSPYSMYDPRVPSAKDPPSSSYRITLVCTLLEVAAKSIVSRNNLPRLKGFLAAFQRYLFTKTSMPTDVEFALLDTFDLVDSYWKRADVRGSGKGGLDGNNGSETGFPQYSTWVEAHVAAVAVEESEAAFEQQKRARLDALADESKSIADIHGPMDERSINDDETGSLLDDDDETLSIKSKDSTVTKGAVVEDETADTGTFKDDDELERLSESDGDEEDDEESEEESETDEEDEEEDEEEFDEAAYMRQLEEEAFERELRMVTMEAIERGKKNASRNQVGESMIAGSQIVKRKHDSTKSSTDAAGPSTGVALGGEAGITFQVLKKGSKGKVEAKELVVPVDTNLAMVATRHDDAAARERDEIKQRVLRYEAQSESSGGNVYLEQEKLQKNRNRPLSMDVIDKNFGTSGGNLHPSQVDKKPAVPNNSTTSARGGGGGSSGAGRGSAGRGGRSAGRGGGRSNTTGRSLF
jgi:regulator of nonsense transcripts 2